MAYKIAPVANFQQFFDNNGEPLAGGKLFTYVAGSFTTLQTTYSNNTGTANANPVVLDSSGRIGPVWLNNAQSYNFVLKTVDEGTILMSLDNVRGEA